MQLYKINILHLGHQIQYQYHFFSSCLYRYP
ncbi:hypothetical protein F383_13964 [Gossypium arboreum]|uniref:Uncharacterized protein n=1 Tax=Gossypium arboreum TaxID=29729 RepID=A0A0B0MBI4_GOSAR|nr:hypothetical protein F383_13964 [Gossypium arboreum]